MKSAFKRVFQVVFALLALLGLFIVFLLNPQLLYAKEKNYGVVSVYSKLGPPDGLDTVILKSIALLRFSELYDSTFQFDLFLNDGSSFPAVPKKIFGDAFAWGYHNDIILNGTTDSSLQFIQMNGYNRQLARTIAHEMMHCLEANHFGLFGSRPLKKIPYWKWEGYPEYIAYRSSIYNEDSLLLTNLKTLDSLKDETNYPAMVNTDEGLSIAGLDYFRWWLMIKYCMHVKHMRFTEIMKPQIEYNNVYSEMMLWYKKQQSFLFVKTLTEAADSP